MTEKVQKTVAKALSEIAAGYAEARPLEKSCEYCPYTGLCADEDIKARVKSK
jgi:hypothetical protein